MSPWRLYYVEALKMDELLTNSQARPGLETEFVALIKKAPPIALISVSFLID
jgi:hypothetical protein